MRTLDLFGAAVSNTWRSKTRTILTALAIFVGAFTLTLTGGLGTGINRYIDDTVSSIGASDVMTVTKASDSASGGIGGGSGPVEYDPDAVSAGVGGGPGTTVTALTPDDLDTLASVAGVLRVEPTRALSADYVQHGEGTKYVASVGSLIPGQSLQLAAGAAPDGATDAAQVVLPVSLVEPLGFDSNDAALGQQVTVAISDAARTPHTVTATVVGVAEETLVGSASLIPNDALADELWALQNTGVPEAQQDRFASATVWFADDATADDIAALKSALTAVGYTGTTVTDQLGAFKTVIDAIVLVLNAFAAIALLAASFGIVNTLYMSVQERTREIGLMKAMGMASGRVFSLFSLEAVFIGFLGSMTGVGLAMLAGSGISSALSAGPFADLAGLTLIAFDAGSVVTIVVAVMAIAFVAGTLPAARAARKDPVEALRYE
ncbi:ABC transporter permease [Microbacterium sp.]|uniref:ABC transporter permease n=1 Tax=Microbacterium sp. TaxID=51671 RepID=UPI003C761634